jgi:hypothetical protein
MSTLHAFGRRRFPTFQKGRTAAWVLLSKNSQLLNAFGFEMPIAFFCLAPADEVARAIQKRDQQRPDNPVGRAAIGVGVDEP